jgi:hypothetical protein
MDELDRAAPSRVVSLPNLIAWLSLCVLAAAWGHTLDDRWQTVWAQMGAFGLAAAVGLGALEKARVIRQNRVRNCALRARLECGLARLNEHGATLESINGAVQRIIAYAVRHKHGESRKAPRVARRLQEQLLNHFPIEITPVEDRGESDCELIDPITGFLRDISSRAVSFEHAEPFGTHLVLLTFELDRKQRLSFVVDVLWTEKSGDGFSSGGTVLAVGAPAGEDLDELLACSAAGSI